jgi:DNA-binding NtrC family response regulator
MRSSSILLISTDAQMIASVRRAVTGMGHKLRTARTLAYAATTAALRTADLVIVQTDAPGSDVRDDLARGFCFRHLQPVLALARHGRIDEAVRSVRAGARDYVKVHPGKVNGIRTKIDRALRHGRNEQQEPGVESGPLWRDFITVDYRMRQVIDLAWKVGDSKLTLLIEGESGTGKTFLARRIHESSTRRFGPFVEINCGALPESLLEGELFGHARGAFTSAERTRRGRFESAHGGTLLLDDIGSASRELQARLLRIVESGQFERIGEHRTLESDVRLIVATKGDLRRKTATGRFRDDLFHRLNFLKVRLPPLRERVEDVPVLMRHFLREFAAKHHRLAAGFEAEAAARLVRYAWPGNVRELRNVIEHGVVMAAGETVGLDDLPGYVAAATRAQARRRQMVPNSLREAMREPERRCILAALRRAGWNKQFAARKLRISRSTLYKKIKEHGLGPGRSGGGMALGSAALNG